MASRRHGLVQPVGTEGAAPAPHDAGDAFLQSPDPPPRAGARAAHRGRPKDRRHGFVPGDLIRSRSRPHPERPFVRAAKKASRRMGRARRRLEPSPPPTVLDAAARAPALLIMRSPSRSAADRLDFATLASLTMRSRCVAMAAAMSKHQWPKRR